MIYALWYGGCSYTLPEMSDLEVFPNLKAVKEALYDRYDSNGTFYMLFDYVNRDREKVLLPAVDVRTTSMDVFGSDPRKTGELVPDWRLGLTKRLTVRQERF